MKALRPTNIPFPSSGQFIRNSTATYIEDGVLKTAAINEPRWQDGKLLLEGAGTNLIIYSKDFSHPSWVKTNITVTEDAGASLSGVVDADAIIPTTSNTVHYCEKLVTGVYSDGEVFTYSVDVQDFGYSRVRLQTYYATNGGSGRASTFSIADGTIENGAGCVGRISYPKPGIARCEITVTVDNSALEPSRILCRLFVLSPTAAIYAGDGVSGVLVSDAQLERVSATSPNATSRIPTTTAPATRKADICIGNFSRSSIGTYVDDNGVIQTVGVNVPRIQNGQLLVEGAATNLVANNSMIGASSGSPGVLPTGWSSAAPTGITRTVVGVGVELGVQYVDIRFSGTNTSGSVGLISVLFGNSSGAVPAALGSIWTPSVYLKIAGGSLANLSSAVIAFYEKTAANAFVRTASGPLHTVTSSLQRFASPATVQGATTAFVDSPQVYFSMGVGASVDITLRVGFPQFEAGVAATSVIPTTTAPTTRAADVHTAGLVYTNATDVRPLWSSATTYSTGQIIRYNNIVYESLQSTNLNRQPDTSPTWWLSLGADNISAAFDGKVGTKTTATDKLRMIIKPGTNIDSAGYIEATTSTISTSAIDEDYNTVYSYKSGLSSSVIEDWYDYFFLDPLGDPLTQVVHQGINSLDPNLIIGVEMIRSGDVELGVFVTGQTTNIGKTQYGLRAGIVDYSKKEADEFGNVTIVERTYSKRLEGDVYVYNYDLNKVQRFLYNVRATPVLWIASDDTELAEVSNVYGFYKDFSTTIAYPDVSMCSLQIEGLT